MSTPTPWPELQPLAARIAVGELDGDAAIAAIIDAITRREMTLSGDSAAATAVVKAEASRAVAADRVLVAMLRPVAPTRAMAAALERHGDDRRPPVEGPRAPRAKVRVAPELRDAGDDEALGSHGGDPRAFERAQGGRRMTAAVGVTLGVVAGGLIWWFLLRESPCEQFARQVCRELPEPCSAGEVEKHLVAKATTDAACDSARAAAELASSTAGPSKRTRAYELAVIEALGFDPRTGLAPTAAVTERAPVAPMMLARKLPSLPSLVADEAYLYVSSGEAVLRLRSTGGQFETLAVAPGGHNVVVTADFVYWAARGPDGSETLWVDRKRGEYEPTTIATAPTKVGASACTQGACAWVDTTDGAVWLAVQDGTAPKKMTGAQAPAVPTEVWLDDHDVAFAVPGATKSVVAVPAAGGAPRVIAGAETDATQLRGDAESWFWIAAGGALRTVPRAGGDVTTLVPAGVTAYALDKTVVFVGDATAGTIAHVPRAGGTPTPVIGGQPGLEHVVIDAAAVYWTRAGELLRLPK